ncbi:hypothetical protein MMC17_001898 [Xylographa soralifera]|nr:hypothetical protein [Xylographa soralifera]
MIATTIATTGITIPITIARADVVEKFENIAGAGAVAVTATIMVVRNGVVELDKTGLLNGGVIELDIDKIELLELGFNSIVVKTIASPRANADSPLQSQGSPSIVMQQAVPLPQS